MNRFGNQKQQIVNKIGSLNKSVKSDQDGLIDLLDIKSKPMKVYLINQKELIIACIDEVGNPFLFYYDKNRYININVSSPAQIITFIDKDQGLLAISLKSNQILICSLINGKILKTLRAHDFHIVSMDVNYERGLFLSASQDQSILWDLKTFERKNSLFASNTKIIYSSFSVNGYEIVSIFDDGIVCVWSLSSFDIISKSNLGQKSKICQIVRDPISHKLFVHQHSNKLYQLDEQSIESVIIPEGYRGVEYVAASKYAFILTKTFQILIVDQQQIISMVKLPTGKTPISIAAQYDRLLVALNTGEILLYDIDKIIATAKQMKQISSGLSYNGKTQLQLTNLLLDKTDKENISQINYSQEKQVNNIDTGTNKKSQSLNKKNTETNISQAGFIDDDFKDSHKKSKKLNSTKNVTLTDSQLNSSSLETNKLRNFLKKFGVFPDARRGLVWSQLLKIPLNIQAYDDLCKLGTHQAYQKLSDQYPLKSQSLLNRLQKILSCLANYCPLFAEINYLPELVFPFVKLFNRGDDHTLFEIILSIIVQFCQRNYEYFPNVPVGILQLHDQLLKQFDGELYSHLKDRLQYIPSQHVWPGIKNFYTDILTREQWLSVMDYLIAYNDQPWLFILVNVAFLIYFRSSILKMNAPDQWEIFLSRMNPIDGNSLMKKVIQMSNECNEAQFCLSMEQNLPLISPQYQIFNLYPKHSVEFQKNVRQSIQDDKLILEGRQQKQNELQILTDEMLKLEGQLRDRQDYLIQAGKDRQDMQDYENEMRMRYLAQQDNQLREKRFGTIKRVEQFIKDSLDQQDKIRMRQDEIIVNQIQRQRDQDNQLIIGRKEDEALIDLEQRAYQRFQDILMIRNQQDRDLLIQQELNFIDRQNKLKEQSVIEQWRSDELENQLKLELVQHQQLQQKQIQSVQNDKIKADQQSLLSQTESDLKLQILEREKKLREINIQERLKNDHNEQILQSNQEYPNVKTIQINSQIYQQQQFKQPYQQYELSNNDRLNFVHQNSSEQINQSNRLQEFQYKINELELQNQQAKINQLEKETQQNQLKSNQINKQSNVDQGFSLQDLESKEREAFYRELERQEQLIKHTQFIRSQQLSLQQQSNNKEHLSRETQNNDERLREIMIKHEQDIILKAQNIRKQLQNEQDIYQTGQFQSSVKKPYSESPFSYDDNQSKY